MTDAAPRTRAEALFATHVGGAPTIRAQAPARVNIIGEHVDYANGIVLPMAIDRSTAIVAREAKAGSATRLWSESHGSAVAHADAPSWVAYVQGPLTLLRERGFDVPPLDIAIASDVPAGGGLASSAALAVASALVGVTASGASITKEDLVSLCQTAEHRFAGTPCGPMDMTVILHARAQTALRLDCRDGAIQHVPWPQEAAVLLIDSGVRHRLSDGGYAERRRSVELAAAQLGVPALRDAGLEDWKRLNAPLDRRARHVVSEIARTVAATDALFARDLAALGALLSASHRSLRDDYEVSVPELDAIVERATGTPGVYGARLVGGGFGGFVLVLVDRAHANAIGRSVAGGQPWFVTTAVGGAAIL